MRRPRRSVWKEAPRLSSAKTKVLVKRPPLPGGTRDASHGAHTSSPCRNRLAACVCGRWPERCPGWVPVIQGLTRSEVCLGCNAFPTLSPSSSDGVRWSGSRSPNIESKASAEPFAHRVCLGRPHGCSQNPDAQIRHSLVQFLREDAIPVVDHESIQMVAWQRLPQL